MFVLLVLLPITASDYTFDIVKSFISYAVAVSFILLEKETGIAGTTHRPTGTTKWQQLRQP
jgi:predicted methyltransferase